MTPHTQSTGELESILHLNGCQQRAAGYNDALDKKDIDTDDMERLEAITLKEVTEWCRTEAYRLAREAIQNMPDDSIVTTKYGYNSDEKKYGYRLALAELQSLVKEGTE